MSQSLQMLAMLASTQPPGNAGRAPAMPTANWCEQDEDGVGASGVSSPRPWEQFGNNTAQPPGKTGWLGRPESKARQQDRQSGLVCKTSIGGSNPPGASKFRTKSRITKGSEIGEHPRRHARNGGVRLSQHDARRGTHVYRRMTNSARRQTLTTRVRSGFSG